MCTKQGVPSRRAHILVVGGFDLILALSLLIRFFLGVLCIYYMYDPPSCGRGFVTALYSMFPPFCI
jgi:hypothetical protein